MLYFVMLIDDGFVCNFDDVWMVVVFVLKLVGVWNLYCVMCVLLFDLFVVYLLVMIYFGNLG